MKSRKGSAANEFNSHGSTPNMSAGILLVTRTGSTRLPQKPLLTLGDCRVIDQLIRRTQQIRLANEIILCTTKLSGDDALEKIGHQYGLNVFRGSETNVPARMLMAARKYRMDFVVVVEGDEIFFDPQLADQILASAQKMEVDFITFTGLTIGASLAGIRTSALEYVCALLGTRDDVNTDGWGRYFTETSWFNTLILPIEDSRLHRPEYRLTLDYPEDYTLAQELYGRLYTPGHIVQLREALALLDQDPALVAINHNRVEEYESHIMNYPPLRTQKTQTAI